MTRGRDAPIAEVRTESCSRSGAPRSLPATPADGLTENDLRNGGSIPSPTKVSYRPKGIDRAIPLIYHNRNIRYPGCSKAGPRTPHIARQSSTKIHLPAQRQVKGGFGEQRTGIRAVPSTLFTSPRDRLCDPGLARNVLRSTAKTPAVCGLNNEKRRLL